MKQLNSIAVIRDTREKKYIWNFSDFPEITVTDNKLDTGDYSIAGYENEFVIERKHSITELYHNFASSDKTRMLDVIERLSKIKHAYYIIECSISDLYLPNRFSKVSPNYILSCILSLTLRGINVIWAGDKGEYIAGKLIQKYSKGISHI
jgi:hypothetical protein